MFQKDLHNTKKILKDIFNEIYNLNKFELQSDILEKEEILLLDL